LWSPKIFNIHPVSVSTCFTCPSRLEYCNGLLIDLPVYLIRRLQSVQSVAARLIHNPRRCDHISDALIRLHWLRVPRRISSYLQDGGAGVPRTARHRTTLSIPSAFTCVADMGSGPHPLNRSTFHPYIGHSLNPSH